MTSSWRHKNVITLESRSTCSCRTEILLEYHFQDYEDFWSHWLLDNDYRLTLDFDHLNDLLTFAFLFQLSSVYFQSKIWLMKDAFCVGSRKRGWKRGWKLFTLGWIPWNFKNFISKPKLAFLRENHKNDNWNEFPDIYELTLYMNFVNFLKCLFRWWLLT